MIRADIPLMAEQLSRLSEIYEKKPMSEKAVEVWFDTLREFRTECVMSILINIPKRQGKWPTPYEVWKICNDVEIDRREDLKKLEDLQRDKEVAALGSTDRGREIIAGIRAILRKPRMTPIEHWQRVREGDYPQASKDMANQALAKLMGVRQPGEDDE